MRDALGMIAGAVALLGRIKEIADKTKYVDLRSLIADLQLKLADVKNTMSEVVEEKTRLKGQSAGTPQRGRAVPEVPQAWVETAGQPSASPIRTSRRHSTDLRV
jgi:hypothetical protein